jgi:hypothetical protein
MRPAVICIRPIFWSVLAITLSGGMASHGNLVSPKPFTMEIFERRASEGKLIDLKYDAKRTAELARISDCVRKTLRASESAIQTRIYSLVAPENLPFQFDVSIARDGAVFRQDMSRLSATGVLRRVPQTSSDLRVAYSFSGIGNPVYTLITGNLSIVARVSRITANETYVASLWNIFVTLGDEISGSQVRGNPKDFLFLPTEPTESERAAQNCRQRVGVTG